jgi:hypothetical protein
LRKALKVKVKESSGRAGHKHPGREKRYSYTLSLTLELDRVRGEPRAPASLPQERHAVPTGWAQEQSGRVRVVSSPQGFDPRTVQPLALGQTDCAFLFEIVVFVVSLISDAVSRSVGQDFTNSL